jgi:hypothetical protein
VSIVLVPGECGDDNALLNDAVELGVRCDSRSSFNTRSIRRGLEEGTLIAVVTCFSGVCTGIEEGGVLYFEELEAFDSVLIGRDFVFDRSRGAGLFEGVTWGRILARTLVRRTNFDPDRVDAGIRVDGLLGGVALVLSGMVFLGGVTEPFDDIFDFWASCNVLGDFRGILEGVFRLFVAVLVTEVPLAARVEAGGLGGTILAGALDTRLLAGTVAGGVRVAELKTQAGLGGVFVPAALAVIPALGWVPLVNVRLFVSVGIGGGSLVGGGTITGRLNLDSDIGVIAVWGREWVDVLTVPRDWPFTSRFGVESLSFGRDILTVVALVSGAFGSSGGGILVPGLMPNDEVLLEMGFRPTEVAFTVPAITSGTHPITISILLVNSSSIPRIAVSLLDVSFASRTAG